VTVAAGAASHKADSNVNVCFCCVQILLSGNAKDDTTQVGQPSPWE